MHPCICLMALVGSGALAMEPDNRTTLKLSDPAKPATFKASVFHGNLRVVGYEGQEIVLEGGSPATKSSDRYPGMKRIVPRDGSLREHDNVVVLETSPLSPAEDWVVKVPTRTNLKLSCVEGKQIQVENIAGRVDVQHVNGSIHLSGLRGNVTANTVNGSIRASFQQVDPSGSISLATFNGSVDLTLPSNTRADLSLSGMSGKVESDFELKGRSSEKHPGMQAMGNRMSGTLNGGGCTISIRTFQGSVKIRRGQ